MLAVFPLEVARAVQDRNNFDNLLDSRLVEINARASQPAKLKLLGTASPDDLKYVTDRIGDFDADNRAGMERLHSTASLQFATDGQSGWAYLQGGAGGPLRVKAGVIRARSPKRGSDPPPPRSSVLAVHARIGDGTVTATVRSGLVLRGANGDDVSRVGGRPRPCSWADGRARPQATVQQ